MYKLKLVLGLRKAGEKREGKELPRTFGGIAIMKVMDDETTELVGADNMFEAANTKTLNAQVLKDDIKYIQGSTIPEVFIELRDSFNKAPVNTDADVLISIGDKSHSLIEDFIPREVYLRTKDDTFIKYYLQLIKGNSILGQIMR